MADANYTMNPDCQDAYNAVKDPEAPARFAIFKIENEVIMVEKVGDSTSAFTDFINALPQNEPRYCAYDYHYHNEEGHPRSKLIFIFWTPDTAHPRMKMVYASGVKSFVRRLPGIQKEIQATDLSDVQPQAIERSLRFA